MSSLNYNTASLTDSELYNNYLNNKTGSTTSNNKDNDSTSLNTTNGVSTGASKPKTKQTGNSDLGKEAFLQLLVTQMQYQDPLDPQDNSEYIAQLANFSTLEQMTNLNEAMEAMNTLVDNINSSLLIGQTSNFIGKDIEWENDKGEMQTGTVTGIKIVDGQPMVLVGDIIVEISKIHGVGTIPGYEDGDSSGDNSSGGEGEENTTT